MNFILIHIFFVFSFCTVLLEFPCMVNTAFQEEESCYEIFIVVKMWIVTFLVVMPCKLSARSYQLHHLAALLPEKASLALNRYEA